MLHLFDLIYPAKPLVQKNIYIEQYIDIFRKSRKLAAKHNICSISKL